MEDRTLYCGGTSDNTRMTVSLFQLSYSTTSTFTLSRSLSTPLQQKLRAAPAICSKVYCFREKGGTTSTNEADSPSMGKPRSQRFVSNPDDVFHADVQRPVEHLARVPHSQDFNEYRLLCNAVIDGKVDVLRTLLVERGLDPNTRSSTGDTAGHQAATDGRVEEMSMLLCHGLDVDAVNDDGNTALHLASRHGRAGVARRLAEAFPDEDIRNRRGFTALDEAVQAGREGCTNCIRDFAEFGKAEALEEHCRMERDRLEKVRRTKEILYGRDLDVRPRDDDFRSMRASTITAADKALICVSLQASAVALRCIAAGLRCAESALGAKKTKHKHVHPRRRRRNPSAKGNPPSAP